MRGSITFDPSTADSAIIDRFWSSVEKRGPDECWEWTGSRKPGGYGTFQIDNDRRTTASRVALALTLGRQLLPSEYACHHCDNPPCCNPAHLFAGTALDNNLDSLDLAADALLRLSDTCRWLATLSRVTP